MIFHKLVFRYLRYGDDRDFYLLQARDTVRWLERAGVALGDGVTALDLGCGHLAGVGYMAGENRECLGRWIYLARILLESMQNSFLDAGRIYVIQMRMNFDSRSLKQTGLLVSQNRGCRKTAGENWLEARCYRAQAHARHAPETDGGYMKRNDRGQLFGHLAMQRGARVSSGKSGCMDA